MSTKHFIASISSLFVDCQYEEFKSNRKSGVTAIVKVPYNKWSEGERERDKVREPLMHGL
jgi:hypothetical protein